MRRSRLLLTVLGVLATALAVAVVRVSERPAAPPPGSQVPSRPAPRTTHTAGERAAGVLHRWDQRRAAAYARGSTSELRALYVAGSPAGQVDVRLLREYLSRGLRVVGLRMQTLGLRVLVDRHALLRLDVTERLVGAVAVGGGGRIALPRDRPDTRRVTLVRGPDARWRVAAVAPVRSAPRPAAR